MSEKEQAKSEVSVSEESQISAQNESFEEATMHLYKVPEVDDVSENEGDERDEPSKDPQPTDFEARFKETQTALVQAQNHLKKTQEKLNKQEEIVRGLVDKGEIPAQENAEQGRMLMERLSKDIDDYLSKLPDKKVLEERKKIQAFQAHLDSLPKEEWQKHVDTMIEKMETKQSPFSYYYEQGEEILPQYEELLEAGSYPNFVSKMKKEKEEMQKKLDKAEKELTEYKSYSEGLGSTLSRGGGKEGGGKGERSPSSVGQATQVLYG